MIGIWFLFDIIYGVFIAPKQRSNKRIRRGYLPSNNPHNNKNYYSRYEWNNISEREYKVKQEDGSEKTKRLDVIEQFSESSEMKAPNRIRETLSDIKKGLTPDDADILSAEESNRYRELVKDSLMRQADKEIVANLL